VPAEPPGHPADIDVHEVLLGIGMMTPDGSHRPITPP